MPKEEIELAPEKEQKPVEVPELEVQPIEEGERMFLSQLDDDLGFLKVVSTIPTLPPKNSFQKVRVYVSGSTFRVYFWVGNSWKYISLT